MWLVYSIDPRRPVTADIRFIGYTNNPAWGHTAQMRVVNTSDFPIALAGWSDVLETKAFVAWRSFPISTPLRGNVLQPGQSEVIEFATPALTNTWRIRVGYYEHEPGMVRTFKAVLYKIGLETSITVWSVESEIVTP